MTYINRDSIQVSAQAAILTFCFMVLSVASLVVITHLPKCFLSFAFMDTFTETMIYDAARSYVAHGFSVNAGLPSISAEWIKIHLPGAKLSPGDHLYLHYPSGPYLLGGMGAALFGIHNAFFLRIIPLGINAGMLFLFLRGVFSVLPTERQRRWFIVCFAVIPIGWAQIYGGAPNHYAHYVLLALIGLLLPALCADQPPASGRLYAAVGLLGFLTGCFALDYFFVTLLAPLAIACLSHGDTIFKKGPLRLLSLRLCAAVGLGFCIAQFLHLMQIAAYFGSVQAAVTDMRGAALFRATGDAAQYHFLTGVEYRQFDPPYDLYAGRIAAMGGITGRIKLIIDYLTVFTAYDTHHELLLVAPIVFYLLFAALYVRHLGDGMLKKRFLTTAAVAVTSCLMWIVVMPSHSAIHPFLIAQHFYLVYILIVLFMAENVVNRAGTTTQLKHQPAGSSG